MLGTFQQSQLRIEVEAPQNLIRDSLLNYEQLRQWLWPGRLSAELTEVLNPGLTFTTRLGPVAIQHQVEVVESNCLRLLLSQGIDGYHEWYWGEGWVQSRLEGVSLLPLNLGQTINLLNLRQFLTSTSENP
ncbi:MAG: hypothetical protein F6K58_26950 [Symploca sp. SIO2E9]|nr:hypothetical protein [Symploca sp. SIO2E9]